MAVKGSLDLEGLREVFESKKIWISIGKILKLDVAKDRSVWRAKVSLFPDETEIIARMTWDQVGPRTGIYGPASVNDLVLVAFEPELETAFIIRRLSSKEDKIPEQAAEGHTFISSLLGKKLYLGSDNQILIGKNVHGSDPDEPLVLGDVLGTILSSWIDADRVQTHLGNLGVPTGPPINLLEYEAVKTQIDNDDFKSEIAFTEKGD